MKRLRAERGLSQRELAKKADVGYVTIARLETGDQIPHPSTIRKLLETLKGIPTLPKL
jgi:predicted transcriptional regulator